jgi:hypothetical protein
VSYASKRSHAWSVAAVDALLEVREKARRSRRGGEIQAARGVPETAVRPHPK